MTKDSSLSKRVATAAVGIPVVLFVVWRGELPLLAVTLLLAVLAMRELQVATAAAGSPLVPEIAYPAVVTAMLLPQRDTLHGLWLMPWVVLLLSMSYAVFVFATRRRTSLISVALTFLAVFYVGLFTFLPLVRATPGLGLGLMWLTLFGVWGGDSAAYFVGRALGRRKLTPLSPGKTWEGIIAGTLVTAVLCALIGSRIGLGFWHGSILGILIGIVAPLGDLVESFWKRELRVKDMGTLLPGHGGVLDRCDSLLFAAATAYVYVQTFIAPS